MKQLLTTLALSIATIVCSAQIGAVKPAEKAYKSTTYSTHVDLQEKNAESGKTYILLIKSENQHDKAKASLSLGNAEEALESVNNLLALYDMSGEVAILGYTFICGKKELTLKKIASFKNTYGTYCIEKKALEKMKTDLENMQP